MALVTPEYAADIEFPTDGWREVPPQRCERQWDNDYGDVLAKSWLPRGDMPTAYADPATTIPRFRQMSESLGGALFSVDSFLEPVPLVQWISKKRKGSGYLYAAFLFIDVANRTIVLTLMAGERGITGLREARVTPMLVSQGRIQIPAERVAPSTPIVGWFVDPYDPDYPGPITRSISDEEEFDSIIPDHPLSRMRRSLSDLRNRMRLEFL